eukprot:TRINITY_DN261_c0_g1_i6.p1 TRINITY_DN261_c0_g1~~TRINITY_DN261_c0_g1_i6.p1  ORF type:complete len:651 (-),score=78.90 TRINITY_DN261_c0_g1_i6:159-2039(-)
MTRGKQVKPRLTEPKHHTPEELRAREEAAALRRQQALNERKSKAHHDIEHVKEVVSRAKEHDREIREKEKASLTQREREAAEARKHQLKARIQRAAADNDYANNVHYENKFRKLLLEKNMVDVVAARKEFARIKTPGQVLAEGKTGENPTAADHVLELRKKFRTEGKRKRLSLVGNSLVLIDQDQAQSIPNGFIELKGHLSATRLARLLEERVLTRFARMRMLVEDGFWTPDPTFDVHRQVFEIPNVKFDQSDDHDDNGPHSMIHIVNNLMNTPLDWHRSPWEIYLMHEAEGGQGRSMIYWRLHHCIGDGTSFGQVIHSLTDQGHKHHQEWEDKQRKRSLLSIGKEWVVWFCMTIYIYLYLFFLCIIGGPSVLYKWYKLASQPVPVNPLKGQQEMSVHKRMAFRHFPLNDVKAVAKRAHVTLNDLCLAAIAGGIRQVYAQQAQRDGINAQVPREDPWLGIPVNVRTAMPQELGNEFGFVTLPLPVHEPSLRRRVKRIKAEMDQIKRTPESLLGYLSSKPTALMPNGLVRKVFAYCTSKLTLVASNVRFPFRELSIDGVYCLRTFCNILPPTSQCAPVRSLPLSLAIRTPLHEPSLSLSISLARSSYSRYVCCCQYSPTCLHWLPGL